MSVTIAMYRDSAIAGRDRDTELDEQVVEDLACRRCVSRDEADAAEPRVVVVVVDVDDERRALEEGRIRPQPALVRAVEGDHDSRSAASSGQLAPELGESP